MPTTIIVNLPIFFSSIDFCFCIFNCYLFHPYLRRLSLLAELTLLPLHNDPVSLVIIVCQQGKGAQGESDFQLSGKPNMGPIPGPWAWDHDLSWMPIVSWLRLPGALTPVYSMRNELMNMRRRYITLRKKLSENITNSLRMSKVQ